MPFAQSILVNDTRYVIDGKEYPRLSVVTSQHVNPQLEQWKRRVGEEEAARVANEAAEYGTAIHEMTARLDTGLFHLDVIPVGKEWLIPFWLEWGSWRDEFVRKILAIEEVVWSDRYWCAGRVDRVVVMRGDRSPSILDIKTGSLSDDFGIDLAGYRYMWNERSKGKAKRRLVVSMPRNDPGKLRVKEYDDPDDIRKWKEMCRDYQMVNK